MSLSLIRVWKSVVSCLVLLALVISPAWGDAKEDQATRRKWESIVVFYGQEDTNRFSLAIQDANAKEEGEFHFKEVWKYDRQKKEWVKMNAAAKATKALPANKRPRGADGPVDAQILVDLPIQIQDVGLYYAKWTLNEIPCTTYMFLGTRARDRTIPGKAPPGHKVEDVPVSVDKSELQIIPDPQYHTGEGSLPIPKK
jgi:hypothetical protein